MKPITYCVSQVTYQHGRLSWLYTYVKPRAKHPCPVLLELEPLDVDVTHQQTQNEKDTNNSYAKLRLEFSAEGVPRYYEGSGCANKR